MKKDRLASFTDSIIAMLMIALVLGLRIPKAASWAAIWDLRT